MLTSNSESMCVAVLRNTRKSIVRFSNEHSKKRNLYRDNILQLDAFFSFSSFVSFSLLLFLLSSKDDRIVSYDGRAFLWHGDLTLMVYREGGLWWITRRNRRLSKSQRFYKYLYIISETYKKR